LKWEGRDMEAVVLIGAVKTESEFVSKAKELRAQADAAEELMFEFLLAGEKRPSLWDGAGLSFLQFIERANLCRAARYDGWKKTREAVGAKAVREAGVAAAVAASVLPDDAKKEVIDQARTFRDTNGTPPSEQTARSIVRDVKQRDAALRTKNKGYLDLANENAFLRRENERLRDENMALKAELRQIKKPAKRKVAA